MTGFVALDEDLVYEGWAIQVVSARFRAPDGAEFRRDVVHHPGAVAIIPIIEGDVVMVRQYRPALDQHLLEIPAGLRDIPGEPLVETARRELVEEVGMIAGSLELLTSVHNSVGFCDEQIHIFLGTDISTTKREMTDSPEEHDMEIVRISLLEAEQMILRGEITDAKTVIGVLATLRR
ncbi:MAG: NUDIX hydrolase [Acidimicrobiia bacterium]|nr:NUDIX hydrolase [Acidimicrobiia bacterium]